MQILSTSVNSEKNIELVNFTQGLDVDIKFFSQEIAVQLAWAKGLISCGYLSESEWQSVKTTLNKAKTLIEQGAFDWRIQEEDIHMNLERFVTGELGELGKKIHYGRSRNDLIATSLRLFVAECAQNLVGLTKELGKVVVNKSEAWLKHIVPGMTHLQSGQPIRLGHMFSAHAFALSRDLHRFESIKSICLEALPLGAAAFSGTHLPIDLDLIAKELGFQRSCQHSYDAVGDRDFMLELLNALSLTAGHLSRLSNEIMFLSSTAVGLLRLPQNWSTGSSIMPNKRNPDVLEITRAKMARVIAAASEGANLVSSVVPSYGSDLHELKRTVMRSFDESVICLKILAPFCHELAVEETAISSLKNKGHILATEVANSLTKKGLGFRDAYKKTAEFVALADNRNLQIHELEEVRECLGGHKLNFESAVELRQNSGGTSLQSAKNALAEIRQKLI